MSFFVIVVIVVVVVITYSNIRKSRTQSLDQSIHKIRLQYEFESSLIQWYINRMILFLYLNSHTQMRCYFFFHIVIISAAAEIGVHSLANSISHPIWPNYGLFFIETSI